LGLLKTVELDHHEPTLRSFAFERRDPAAANDEAPTERFEGRFHLRDVRLDAFWIGDLDLYNVKGVRLGCAWRLGVRKGRKHGERGKYGADGMLLHVHGGC
jgi:hypothetical protein